MDAAALDVLYEDNHCLAIAKPAGVPSTHFDGTEETIDRAVKGYLKAKYAKPGNVFLGVVHRLDKPTSGVLLFARTSKAAARLAEQFREGAVEKVYWAVVEGEPPQPAGTLEDWLRKDESAGRVEVVPPERPSSAGYPAGAKRALVHYHRKAGHGGLTLVELRPQTGRTHQLRVQLAHRRHPVVGDFKYGSETPFAPGIALHARRLTFLHPTRHEPVTVTADLPRSWRGRFAHLLRESPP
ncbi:MAG TPA: RluA family pseudouridine synthase [Gemmataceae bacterium]|jgi:23S rRNA pseudouridine1911/1915/1917 synthase